MAPKSQGKSEKVRCEWCISNPIAVVYHDEEWGVPLHDDRMFFEFIVLDGAQAGLSWNTILNKRQRYREVFDNFDVQKVARYTSKRMEKLLLDPGIVRNRQKVASAVVNAKAFIGVQKEFGSFDEYIWRFVDGRPVQNSWRSTREVPATSSLSDTISKDLKQRGFSFVGSTIIYAFLQAAGLVNDHLVDCHRYTAIRALGK